jgi:hypothetical protein
MSHWSPAQKAKFLMTIEQENGTKFNVCMNEIDKILTE